MKGEYGKTPVEIDPAFRKKIIGDEKPIDCGPADLLEPEMEKMRAEFPAEYLEQGGGYPHDGDVPTGRAQILRVPQEQEVRS